MMFETTRTKYVDRIIALITENDSEFLPRDFVLAELRNVADATEAELCNEMALQSILIVEKLKFRTAAALERVRK